MHGPKNCVGKKKEKSNGTRLIAYLGMRWAQDLLDLYLTQERKEKIGGGGGRDRCRLSFDDFR